MTTPPQIQDQRVDSIAHVHIPLSLRGVYIHNRVACKVIKPKSRRFLDRTIGCDLAKVRPIVNVCYDLQERSHTAIGLWLIVGHRTIGLTRGRAITNDRKRWVSRSIVGNRATSGSLTDRTLSFAYEHQSYDQSCRLASDRMINLGILRSIVRSIVASCDLSYH